MPEPKVPTAYSSLRILIEITSYAFIAVDALWLLFVARNAGILAVVQAVLVILSILVLKGLAHALLDIADTLRERK